MNIKTLMTTTIATVVLVLLASAVAVPVISEAQKVSGKEVVYENGNLYGYHIGDSTDSATLTFTKTEGWKLNGELVIGGFTVITDTVSIRTATDATGGYIVLPDGVYDIRSTWNHPDASLVFEDGKVIFDYYSSDPVHYEGTYAWILQPKEGGEWQSKAGLGTVYANSINDILVHGFYSSGENDTAYLLKDGVLTAGDYETSVTYDQTKVDGTTDVYQIRNLSLSIGDESFEPWFVLVKSEIIGHEDHGATYSLIGIIPLLIFTGLIIGVIGSFIRNRD